MDNLIAEWKRATIDQSMVDEAELELRRLMDADKIASQEEWTRCRALTAKVTRGELEQIFILGQEVALQHALTRRITRKADHEMQIERLRNYVTCLEARIKQIEKKSRGAGPPRR